MQQAAERPSVPVPRRPMLAITRQRQSTSSMLWATRGAGADPPRPGLGLPAGCDGSQTKRGRQRCYAPMQTGSIRPDQAGQGIPAVPCGTEKVNGEWSLICTGHNLLKLFRFGVNLHRKARADGPTQRIRNFAEVVSTALFAKLSGGPLGQPAKWRRPAAPSSDGLLGR